MIKFDLNKLFNNYVCTNNKSLFFYFIDKNKQELSFYPKIAKL